MADKKNDGYFVGKLLIAMPSMGDPRFHRSVIYMCVHDENGAMGLMINQKIPGVAFDQLLEQLNLASDITIDRKALNIPVMHGGPVENSRGFLLHSNDFKQDDTIHVADDFSVSGTLEALEDVAKGAGPKHMLFILGYAGWESGQLDQEIQQNAWLVVDPDPTLIFHEQESEKWDLAIEKLGINPGMLSGDAGQA